MRFVRRLHLSSYMYNYLLSIGIASYTKAFTRTYLTHVADGDIADL